MNKSRKILQRVVAAVLIVLSIIMQVTAAGRVINGATILAVIVLMSGMVLLIFDINKIKGWIKGFFCFGVDNEESEEVDIISCVASSDEENQKEGIIIQFPEASDK